MQIILKNQPGCVKSEYGMQTVVNEFNCITNLLITLSKEVGKTK